MSGEIIGRFFKLKGEIDPNEAIDISNHASLAFLQKHLSKYLFTSKYEVKLILYSYEAFYITSLFRTRSKVSVSEKFK